LAPEREKRFQTAAEFKADLELASRHRRRPYEVV
jgi:hypothetical protein